VAIQDPKYRTEYVTSLLDYRLLLSLLYIITLHYTLYIIHHTLLYIAIMHVTQDHGQRHHIVSTRFSDVSLVFEIRGYLHKAYNIPS